MHSSLKKYLNDVVNTYDENYPDLSWGRSYLYVLYRFKPKLALHVINSCIDPTYNDKNIPYLIKFVTKNWDEKNIQKIEDPQRIKE